MSQVVIDCLLISEMFILLLKACQHSPRPPHTKLLYNTYYIQYSDLNFKYVLKVYYIFFIDIKLSVDIVEIYYF